MSDPSPRCRCCGSQNVSLRGTKPGQFIRREFEFHACRECGFVMVEPFSGFEIYNDAYYRGAGPDPYVDYETEYHRWRETDRLLEFEDLTRIAERFTLDQKTKGPRDQETSSQHSRTPVPAVDFGTPVTPNPKLKPQNENSNSKLQTPNSKPTDDPVVRWLDFGCGAGGFLKFLRERGTIANRPLELTGHDVGSYAELLKAKDGFRILDFDEITREPDGRYDVISMVEVIEHLPAPLEPMQLVARLLKPGGLLLLTTGNLESPIARRQGIHYRYCAPEIHVSLFNPRCLSTLYRRVGLSPLSVRYHGAVKFKVVKSLRHRRALRAAASAALALRPVVRAIDHVYGVSAMPCAVKSQTPNFQIPNNTK